MSRVKTRFYKRIASPILLDPQIDWGGLPVADVLPRHIPDVFSAGPIIVKGRYTHPGEGDITLRGILRGKPWQRTIHVVFPTRSKSGSAIPTLWAREKIDDLQLQQWEAQYGGKPTEPFTKQIEAVALEYRLLSEFTSFVAVEEKVVNVGGRQRHLEVPVEMPEGVSYNGIFGEAETKGKQQLFGFGRGAMATQLSLGMNPGLGYSRSRMATRGKMSAGKPMMKSKAPSKSG